MKTKNKKPKKDIEYGDVEMDLDNIKPSEVKVRVTTYLDEDVREELKKRSAAIGVGYQTYLNQFLRETLMGEPGLISRIEKLEKAVFEGKKRA